MVKKTLDQVDPNVDPIDVVKAQVTKAKEQYLNLLASGKIKDKNRIEEIQSQILALDNQMYEMEMAHMETKRSSSKMGTQKTPTMRGSKQKT
jgi:hypothetical protein